MPRWAAGFGDHHALVVPTNVVLVNTKQIAPQHRVDQDELSIRWFYEKAVCGHHCVGLGGKHHEREFGTRCAWRQWEWDWQRQRRVERQWGHRQWESAIDGRDARTRQPGALWHWRR
jgi:hypothetical protein